MANPSQGSVARGIVIGCTVMRTDSGRQGQTFKVTHFDEDGDPCGSGGLASVAYNCEVIPEGTTYIVQSDASGHVEPSESDDARSAAERYVWNDGCLDNVAGIHIVTTTANDGTKQRWRVRVTADVVATPMDDQEGA